MAKYIESILEPEERVEYRVKVHWIAYWALIVYTVLMLVVPQFVSGQEADAQSDRVAGIWIAGIWISATVWVLTAWIFWLPGFIKRRTTEFALTDRRVIAKTGWIKRNTQELQLSKVEGVEVDQGVIGRLLGFGTVTVKGTGGGIAPFKYIASPLDVRRHVRIVQI